jgi:hypothetical protein
MKIHITIDADSGDDLRRGLFDLLVERHAVDAVKKLVPKPDVAEAASAAFDDMPVQGVAEAPEAPPTVARRKHRATIKPGPASVPKPEPVDEEEIAMPPEPEKEPFVDEPEDADALEQAMKSNGSAADAVANEKLKKETIAKLAELFTAGKVKVVRHVLEKYGQGAKSFPEIDASQFPLIRDAIAKGETA